MQCTFAIIASFWVPEILALGPRPPANWQVFVAAWNAGPLKLIPSTVTDELPGDFSVEKPSPPAPKVGSGKFGTSWARMHLASANCGLDVELCVDAALGLELPHAATAVAQPKATTAIQPLRCELRCGLLVGATCMTGRLLGLACRVGF
jgi:hypothetical protein